MNANPMSDRRRTAAACALLAGICVGTVLLTAAVAPAQESDGAKTPAAVEQPGLFGRIGRWFDRQTSRLGSQVRDAGSQVESLGQEAGTAAKTTAETAKNAADAVARIPAARVVAAREKCNVAPNGAPDCVAAVESVCKAKGFQSGKSIDMTTAEVCPAQVYLSGRNSGADCRTETFVSRVLCQ